MHLTLLHLIPQSRFYYLLCVTENDTEVQTHAPACQPAKTKIESQKICFHNPSPYHWSGTGQVMNPTCRNLTRSPLKIQLEFHTLYSSFQKPILVARIGKLYSRIWFYPSSCWCTRKYQDNTWKTQSPNAFGLYQNKEQVRILSDP